jgi:ATP-dependent helicase/nuclease subunit B
LLKLPRYIEAVLEREGTVVVPSRQRAHALRLAYAALQLARGRAVWRSPDVLPLEGWLTREVEHYAASQVHGEGRQAGAGGGRDLGRLPRLLAPAEEWLLWRQCTAAATADRDLLNRASLAESLRRSSALAADLQIDSRAMQAAAGAEAALLARAEHAVGQRCQALGCVPLAAALATLPSIGDQRPVVFAGFAALSPRLRSLVAARAARGHDSAHSPVAVPSAAAPPRVVRPADEREELEHIAQWCRLRLTAQADARLLILLPGSGGRRERLATLIRQAVDPAAALQSGAIHEASSLVGLEGGQPLARVELVAHALASLALLAGESLEVERLLEWLRAPWWAAPDPAGRARIDLWLREQGGLRLDLAALLRVLRGAPAPLAAPAGALTARLQQASAALGAVSGSPREWSERLGTALAALGWPGASPLGSAEQQTLLRFHELLDELGQLSTAARTMTLQVAAQWLAELASRTPYRPSDDDAAVTISPTYADPVVGYDGVWVGGLHAEAFPQPVAPDPFLPLPAQIAAGWPAASAGGRLEEARALLGAWQAAAAELVLSAPARAEDIELLPSPLIEEWCTETQPSVEPQAAMWLPTRLHRPGLLAPWRDEVGLPWSAQRPLPAGTRSLELQNQCPFRAYAELRLGSVPLGMAEPGIAADTRGRLLHAALQRFWEGLGDSRALAALAAEALEELLTASIEGAAAVLGVAGEDPIARAALARECRRTARLMRRLLEIERQRAPFQVRQTEQAALLDLAGQQLRLRIDRLDALASGGLAILDYKSGQRVSADWYGERPSHPQLLAYLAAVGADVVAMATVNVTARDVRFDGVAVSPALLPKVAGVKGEGDPADVWRSRVREWRALVERLALAFAAGEAAVDPKPGACDFCHVAAICRVGDEPLASGDEGSPEAMESAHDE